MHASTPSTTDRASFPDRLGGPANATPQPAPSAPFADPLLAYVAVAYGFTWLVMQALHLEPLAAFGPTLAALLVIVGWRARHAAAPGSVDDLAEWRASLVRWPATRTGRWLTFGAPFGFLAVALLAVAAAPGDFDWSRLANGPLATPTGLFELLVFGSLLQALGEEPGWRGWFLPKLRERLGACAATLVLFPVWLLWHLPMFLARPEFGLPQFAGFALGILSAAVWMTAIYEHTKSALAAIAFHLLINATRGVALAISTPAFLSYGMAVTLGAIAIAVVAWRRRPERGRDAAA
ncbi:MAG: CPBP family intramembrane metalloprotease [Steroidobacteraceae bacterium]|jgi:membrane protease YdiL (CAAX protease family)|nr:CPBP family intramembrane metalloprotease [Steroidobacteraceae bacterium]